MIERGLASRVDVVYALLRVLSGSMFSFHGMQKVFGVLSTNQPPVLSQIWIGGAIEVVAGLAIAVGFLTRWAALVSSGTMAVAYVQFHWQFAFGAQLIPTINRGELALVYALLFLYVACRGAGPFSLDAARLARQPRSRGLRI